jgi:hypothetical protein
METYQETKNINSMFGTVEIRYYPRTLKLTSKDYDPDYKVDESKLTDADYTPSYYVARLIIAKPECVSFDNWSQAGETRGTALANLYTTIATRMALNDAEQSQLI